MNTLVTATHFLRSWAVYLAPLRFYNFKFYFFVWGGCVIPYKLHLGYFSCFNHFKTRLSQTFYLFILQRVRSLYAHVE